MPAHRIISFFSCRLFPALAVVLLSTLSSCIHNDVPYPRIPQDILSIAAEGESAPADIDPEELIVTLHLDENVDITKVRFTDFTYTEGATPSVNLLEGTYDLTHPVTISLSKYQTYQWVIKAEQDIEREFVITGQIGSSVIDVAGHRIVAYVSEAADITDLEVASIKLGPTQDATMTPDLNGRRADFSRPVHVSYSVFGRTEDWTIYVERTHAIVTTTAVDAWSCVIWAYATAPQDAVNRFQYRPAEADEWIDVPDSYVTHNDGEFSCFIPHLTPLTKYTVRALSDDNIANEITVTTEATMDLPDGSFDQWWLKNNKIWCPWSENGTQFWDTGNTGAATLGQSNVVPTDEVPAGATGKAAKLETKFVGIASIGKLAAGSVYSGSFAKVDGTNGILDFGKPWTLRPTKLRGYYRYNTAPINYTSTELKHLQGRPDSCHIYVALTDWTAPFQIRTNPKNRQLFNPDSPAVIAYGELVFSGNMPAYKEFEIRLKYRSTSRRPSYILITSAASKYGDYFTGGAGAVLYIDQYSLDYDY